MTKQEAKELSIEVWQYLADHPEIAHKRYLPIDLYDKIKNCRSLCPICEVFFCAICPIAKKDDYCFMNSSLYSLWWGAENENKRQKAAQQILKIIQEWNVEE